MRASEHRPPAAHPALEDLENGKRGLKRLHDKFKQDSTAVEGVEEGISLFDNKLEGIF